MRQKFYDEQQKKKKEETDKMKEAEEMIKDKDFWSSLKPDGWGKDDKGDKDKDKK